MILGKVVGTVILKDINRIVNLDQVIELDQYEINKSQDLQNAIRRKWLEIVEGRSDMLRAIATPSQPEQTQQMDQTQLLEMAKEMAKTMAQEMIKNNPDIKVLAKEMATEMVSQINSKIVVQQNDTSKEQQFKIDEEVPENVVIDVNEKNMKSNINEIGTVKEEKADISGSLEKMRRFRRKPISQ